MHHSDLNCFFSKNLIGYKCKFTLIAWNNGSIHKNILVQLAQGTAKLPESVG